MQSNSNPLNLMDTINSKEKKTIIYGASDDLIEIDGAVSEEVNHYSERECKITCSDGTIAKIQYNGNWGLHVISVGTLFEKIVNGNPAEDPHTDDDCKNVPGYSDALVLKPGIEWVKIKGKTYKSAL